MTDTRVSIGPLELKNPVLLASGTFGYGDECASLTDLSRVGGIITKSLSLKPRDGNPPPRIAETSCGMLNSIGLANIGVEKFISDKLPFLAGLETAVIANVAAGSVQEYCDVVSRLEQTDGIDGYEINVSCPNVKEGGLSFGTRKDLTAEITRRVRSLTRKALIIKLTPNVTSIGEFARAVEGEGADAVTAINTLVGLAVDVRRRMPKLSTVTGGLSGPAIKPIALAKVLEAARAVRIPVIGAGGIASAEDALEFLVAGASAVQVGTQNFIDPNAGATVAAGIAAFCEENGIARVSELTGSLRVPDDRPAGGGWQ